MLPEQCQAIREKTYLGKKLSHDYNLGTLVHIHLPYHMSHWSPLACKTRARANSFFFKSSARGADREEIFLTIQDAAAEAEKETSERFLTMPMFSVRSELQIEDYLKKVCKPQHRLFDELSSAQRASGYFFICLLGAKTDCLCEFCCTG